MIHCQCEGIEQLFSDTYARKELKAYRKNGASKSTLMLIAAIQAQKIESAKLLDIGGGVGAIQLALLKDSVASSTVVDASGGYLAVAMEEAERQALRERVSYHHGNFVDIAEKLSPADIVTLDKVICCYDDMPSLVSESVGLAKQYYGIVFPIENFLSQIQDFFYNLWMGITRNPYRSFLHPTLDIEAIIFEQGFKRVSYQRQALWQIILYRK